MGTYSKMPVNAVRTLLLLLLAYLAQSTPSSASEPNQILFLLNSGNLHAAFNLYEQMRQESGRHDLGLLQDMGLSILTQGCRSRDPEIQLLTIFGAGISGNDRAICVLEEGMRSELPELQAVAMNFISKFQNDNATELLNTAMSSNLLQIRLEAAFHLAKTCHPKAPGQIEALMQKVPTAVLPAFPHLLAICGDRGSIKSLQRLLAHPNDQVRVEAILAVAVYGRDDLLPDLRKLSMHLNVAEQEACAIALGMFKDEASSQRLWQLAKSRTPSVKLAALKALYQLGREEARVEVEKLARSEDLFAVFLLGEMPGSEPTLIKIMETGNANARVNACLSLLKLRHPACLDYLPEILIKDNRDLAFVKQASFGKALTAWKAVPSARENFSSKRVDLEVSLNMREQCLAEALELPEKQFLQMAQLIYESNQNDLVPYLTQLLTNLQTSAAIDLLKLHRAKVGSPLIRNYCNLGLFRIREPGPYREDLRHWIAANHSHGLIQFRPMIPWEQRGQDANHYRMIPDDASRLLVESVETLVKTQDEDTIDILLHAIRYGNSKNRYALAGLLMRAAH